MVEIGDVAPPFCLSDSIEQEICLKDYLGKWLVLYYIGSAEGHEYPNLQVGDEVNPRRFLR